LKANVGSEVVKNKGESVPTRVYFC